MRLRIVSDLHFEFMDAGKAREVLLQITGGPDFDVLVVAGDLSDAKHLRRSLLLLYSAMVYQDKKAVYIPGNHEFLGGLSVEGAPSMVKDILDREGYSDYQEHLCFPPEWADSRMDHFLMDGRGKVFNNGFPSGVGTTLWYPHPEPWDRRWADGGICDSAIVDRENIHGAYTQALDDLRDGVQKGDVVVTHHMPLEACVAPRWKGSSMNRYFVAPEAGDLLDLFEKEDRLPSLWIHGHTHDSCDFRTRHGVRVVCNPRGYDQGMRTEPNPNFNPHFTVEI